MLSSLGSLSLKSSCKVKGEFWLSLECCRAHGYEEAGDLQEGGCSPAQALGAVGEQQPKPWQQRRTEAPSEYGHLLINTQLLELPGKMLAVDTLERGLPLIRSTETGESSVSPSQTLAASTHTFFPPVTNRTPVFLQQQPAPSSRYGFCACNACQ